MLRSSSLIPNSQIDPISIAKLSIGNTTAILNNCNQEITLEQHINNLKFNTPTSINNHFLRIEIIQKMILRLTKTNMSKEKLAETLGITVNSLKQLCSKNTSLELIPKINLPLIKLYCKTKF